MFRGQIVIEQFVGSLGRITALLNKHNLEFALIGGLASSIRGRVRVTADIDIVVDCNVAKAIDFLEQLDEKVFRPFVEDPELSIRQFFILPIEDVTSGIRIDMAIGESGFEKMIVQRASMPDGYSVPVATAEDLLLMKLMAGRPQDIGDVKGIVEQSRGLIDWSYCEKLAGLLDEVVQIDLLNSLERLKDESERM